MITTDESGNGLLKDDGLLPGESPQTEVEIAAWAWVRQNGPLYKSGQVLAVSAYVAGYTACQGTLRPIITALEEDEDDDGEMPVAPDSDSPSRELTPAEVEADGVDTVKALAIAFVAMAFLMGTLTAILSHLNKL